MRATIRPYEVSDHRKPIFQPATTLFALAVAWGLPYAALGVHVGLAVLFRP